jgi:protein-histidine N-methyltransferase
LVAAKVLYFGVGGGIMQFIQMLESQEYRGKAQTVWEQDKGVSRKILKVEWMR